MERRLCVHSHPRQSGFSPFLVDRDRDPATAAEGVQGTFKPIEKNEGEDHQVGSPLAPLELVVSAALCVPSLPGKSVALARVTLACTDLLSCLFVVDWQRKRAHLLVLVTHLAEQLFFLVNRWHRPQRRPRCLLLVLAHFALQKSFRFSHHEKVLDRRHRRCSGNFLSFLVPQKWNCSESNHLTLKLT